MSMGINSAVGHAPADLFADEISAVNAGAVTLLSGWTIVANIDLGNVKDGDRLHLNAKIYTTKGGTSGLTGIRFDRGAGSTALIQFTENASQAQDQRHQINAVSQWIFLSAICKIISNGSLNIDLEGMSAGSNGSVPVAEGQIYGHFLKK